MATIGTTHTAQATWRKRWSGIFTWPVGPVDYGLLIATVALVAIGLMMVYSASLFVSLRYQDNVISYYFFRQLTAAVLGAVGILGFLLIDYQLIKRVSTPVMLATLVGLLIVLVRGDTLLGAKRGLYEGSFQPSELGKLITIFYIAHWLSSKGERIKDFGMGFIPFVVVVGIVGGLIAVQPDLSTAILIALVALTMFFVAGARFSHFALIVIIGTLAVLLLISVFPHARERWADYWEMVRDPTQAEWHIRQVFYGLARGGLFGLGLGNSFQKTGPLPVPHTDSILAVIGEELGLVGCLLTLGLLLFIGYRGFRIMRETENSYGKLLALGITSWLVYQAIINAAVMTGVIPFTGLPFPFVSYGGSSMLISLVGVGVLLSISQQNKRMAAGIASPARPKQRIPDRTVRPRSVPEWRKVNAAAGVSRRNRRSYSTRARSHH
jgi:cell division protein FtsW